MPKAEISWRRQTPEGAPCNVTPSTSGKRWLFYHREKRFDQLAGRRRTRRVEDWLALLDSVRRRINRRLLRPEEEEQLLKIISERFPGTATAAATLPAKAHED